ncbi:LytR/AlgR family response regulator transcription factor [Cellulomonas sp. FA1]|uniref:LytR/AlgR family response regulator transcription factor n=1 Tax=Cellulomonas sp. FA1 TaxID=1346710 RepID=UPI00062557DF|nr:LytTR family DNA-binding domain-containing protein [Cellulomonas sp. FA1]
MIRIGIVEDDNACATRLVEHLRRYEREHGRRFAVARFADGAQAVAAHRPGAVDLLLLDVEMPALDGFSAARAIRAVDPDVPIVFVTHLAQQAARGYEVEALGYVVKPVPYFAFAQQVTRALARVRRDHEDALLLTVDGGLERVPVADVVSLESARNRTTVRTLTARHSVVRPLKALEAALPGVGFARAGAGAVVHLRHVLAVRDGEAVLVDGRRVAISRARRKAFLAALTDHLGARAS